MSAFTTKCMTRTQVVGLIFREAAMLENAQLERIVDVILEPALYNVSIVPEGFEDGAKSDD